MSNWKKIGISLREEDHTALNSKLKELGFASLSSLVKEGILKDKVTIKECDSNKPASNGDHDTDPAVDGAINISIPDKKLSEEEIDSLIREARNCAIHDSTIDKIRKTLEVSSPVYPVIFDKRLQAYIDGFQRKTADPDWPVVEVETKDDEEFVASHLTSNISSMPKSWREFWVRVMAKI